MNFDSFDNDEFDQAELDAEELDDLDSKFGLQIPINICAAGHCDEMTSDNKYAQ